MSRKFILSTIALGMYEPRLAIPIVLPTPLGKQDIMDFAVSMVGKPIRVNMAQPLREAFLRICSRDANLIPLDIVDVRSFELQPGDSGIVIKYCGAPLEKSQEAEKVGSLALHKFVVLDSEDFSLDSLTEKC